MEKVRIIEFQIQNLIKVVEINGLLIWRVSDLTIKSLRLANSNFNKILGINFNSDNLTASVLATTFFEQNMTFGESTMTFLKHNLMNYDIGILYPAGFDFASIDYILKKAVDMPLLFLLDSRTYYEFFCDDSIGDVYKIGDLKRNQAALFKVNK